MSPGLSVAVRSARVKTVKSDVVRGVIAQVELQGLTWRIPIRTGQNNTIDR